jgi:hypothetical protein
MMQAKANKSRKMFDKVGIICQAVRVKVASRTVKDKDVKTLVC